MSSIMIGRIIEITNSQIRIALDEAITSAYKVINGDAIRIGGVGNFVRVGSEIYEIVNEKVSLDNNKDEKMNKVNSMKYIICNIIGYIKNGDFYNGSTGKTPNVFEAVYTVTPKELKVIYGGRNDEEIEIGTYLYQSDVEFTMSINKFFASHILIVGNTGSGKSNTLNTIYSELFNKWNTQNSLFLVIDTNGEYSRAFTMNKSVKTLNTYSPSNNDVTIPMELLTSEDWKLLLEATEKTQYPIIKKVWGKIEKEVVGNGGDISSFISDYIKHCITGILRCNANAANKINVLQRIREEFSYIGSEIYTEFNTKLELLDEVTPNVNNLTLYNDVYSDRTTEIVGKINEINIYTQKDSLNIDDFGVLLNVEHLYRSFKYNTVESNTSPMIVRFNSNKRELKTIFKPINLGENKKLSQVLFEEENVLVCNVSRAKKDIRRTIVTFICNKLYKEFTHGGERNGKSLHLIVDEAHNYLSNQTIDKEDAIAKTCIENFESIIKEGRKFGVFLTMATQRPSDITGTLLSQAHNYVIHKLVNPNDINIIKNSVPFIDEMSMQMLKVLASGQAIFSGTAFNRPNIIQVNFDEDDIRVESSTIKLTEMWEEL